MLKTAAKDVRPGDRILAANGDVLTVRSVVSMIIITHDGRPNTTTLIPNQAVTVVERKAD